MASKVRWNPCNMAFDTFKMMDVAQKGKGKMGNIISASPK